MDSNEVRDRRASLLKRGRSVIFISAHSGNSIHTGIFSRRPVGSMIETAPSPRFGLSDDLKGSTMERVERIKDLNVRGFCAQGIVSADGIHPHLHCVVPGGGIARTAHAGSAARKGRSFSPLSVEQPVQKRVSDVPEESVSGRQAALPWRNGRSGPTNLIYRRISVQEFLMRFDLSHPLVQAYRDHAVCVVNSFRSEMTHKKALFGLLTDETLTAKFPAVERKAIRDHVPWTRLVTPGKTAFRERSIDLLDFIHQQREKLVLKPNDDYSDQQSFVGSELDQSGWERAVRQSQRSPYVVQEKVEPAMSVFPMMTYGHLEYREMQVDVHPQRFWEKYRVARAGYRAERRVHIPHRAVSPLPS